MAEQIQAAIPAVSKYALPEEVIQPTRIAPGIFLLYGTFKVGKTTILKDLPNHMVLSSEPRSAEYQALRWVYCEGPKDFNGYLKSIEDGDKCYDYVVVDTVTKLDEWAEIVGTLNYMNTPQGKKFNRPGPGQPPYGVFDSRFQTVHTLPDGNGYQHSRNVMSDWFKRLSKLLASGKAKHIILLAHIKEKFIENKVGDTTSTVDIDLTGKVRRNYAAYSDALGYMYADGAKRLISFKTSNKEKSTSGSRSDYLSDSVIEISEKNEDGTITVNWEKIYPHLAE